MFHFVYSFWYFISQKFILKCPLGQLLKGRRLVTLMQVGCPLDHLQRHPVEHQVQVKMNFDIIYDGDTNINLINDSC